LRTRRVLSRVYKRTVDGVRLPSFVGLPRVSQTTPRDCERFRPQVLSTHCRFTLSIKQAFMHEYCALAHELNQWRSGDARKALQAAAFNQPCVGDAPACFAIGPAAVGSHARRTA
jgi:hypothetical protein